MGRLSNVWQQSRLSLATKLRVYNSLVLSVLLYGCETWTILKTDERKLEAFHMSCQRRILRIRWFHRVTNAEVTSQTEQEDLTSHIHRRRAAVFGHVRQLPEEAPGQMAMRHASWRPSRQQTTLEATTRTTETHLGPTSGYRHRYLHWCCMGYCRRPLQLEGAMTPASQARLMMMMMSQNQSTLLMLFLV